MYTYPSIYIYKCNVHSGCRIQYEFNIPHKLSLANARTRSAHTHPPTSSPIHLPLPVPLLTLPSPPLPSSTHIFALSPSVSRFLHLLLSLARALPRHKIQLKHNTNTHAQTLILCARKRECVCVCVCVCGQTNKCAWRTWVSSPQHTNTYYKHTRTGTCICMCTYIPINTVHTIDSHTHMHACTYTPGPNITRAHIRLHTHLVPAFDDFAYPGSILEQILPGIFCAPIVVYSYIY